MLTCQTGILTNKSMASQFVSNNEKLSNPTPERAAQAYELATHALSLARALPKTRNLHCIPPLLLQAASCKSRDEALAIYKQVKSIAENSTSLAKQQQEIILAVVAHNRKQIAASSDSADVDDTAAAVGGYVQDGMVEEVRVPCGTGKRAVIQRLFVMGQSAQVLGLHVDGGLWNMPTRKKAELLKKSRWIFGTKYESSAGGGGPAFGMH
jgi:hypothetical protein